MRTNNQFLCAAFFFIGICVAESQSPSAINQVDDAQLRENVRSAARQDQDGYSVPQLYRDEDRDVGPQTVLQPKTRRTWFQAGADVQYFFTDNMFLSDNFKRDADVLVSTAEFAFAPTFEDVLGGRLAPRVGYRHQWFDFGLDGRKLSFSQFGNKVSVFRLNDFDFNAQTVFGEVNWLWNNWKFGAGADYLRLMSTGDYKEFYKEVTPRWYAQKTIQLSEQVALLLGYEGNFHFAESETFRFTSLTKNDYNQRTDEILQASLTYAPCQYVVVQPYYRFRYTHFTEQPNSGRDDYLHSFGLALYGIVTKNFNVRVFFAYDMNRTDSFKGFEYNKMDVGGGLNATFVF